MAGVGCILVLFWQRERASMGGIWFFVGSTFVVLWCLVFCPWFSAFVMLWWWVGVVIPATSFASVTLVWSRVVVVPRNYLPPVV
ncbi:hypothetical protein A2U01_0007428 [Trifolium medium]|uniref:Transmembrane protein n=1 Tax=Trifolium medium TaxID=97028 RepID=A0A392MGE0_9FABA|nr:hypothetical protein [Trifolium medium]